MTADVIDSLAKAALGLALPCGSALHLVRVCQTLAVDLPVKIQAAAPRRQNTFAAGRKAAAAALREAGLPNGLLLEIGPDGLPVWPTGWLGSISHTDSIAAAVVAPARSAAKPVAAEALGLDLERIVTPDLAREIAAEIMPEAPPGRTSMAPEVEVTCVFSAKEALYKALFPLTRQFREFSAARIDWTSDDEGRRAAAHLTLTERWGPSWPAGTMLDVRQTIIADHVLTVIWR